MSTAQLKISVYELVGGNSAIAVEDGQVLFVRIKNALEKDLSVEVSFTNVSLIVSSFLNASIGQLYGEFSDNLLSKKLKVTGLSDDDVELLSTVIQRAKEYFSKQSNFAKALKEDLGDDS